MTGERVNEKRAQCSLSTCQRWFTFDATNIKGTSYPFCSPACKGVDLLGWVEEEYRLPSLPDLRGIEEDEEAEG